MNPLNRTALIEAYQRERERLLIEFPELAEDDATLADTLEGETEAPDVVAAFIREAREDEAAAKALGSIMDDMKARCQRIAARGDRRRQAAFAIMRACEIRKIEKPDFTASVRATPLKVEIDDEAALPDQFIRIKREPDKTAIKKALEIGAAVPGAHLTNGGETLSIRTR